MRFAGLRFQHEFLGLLFLGLLVISVLFFFFCYFFQSSLNYNIELIDCFAELIDPSLRKLLKPFKNVFNGFAEVD